ncbi:MAG: IF2 family translation initiation factor [Mycobacterium sp.]
MKITDIPFAALRMQYRIARAPLRLFEQGVLTRIDSEAPARLLYERSVGAVDSAVGSMLRDADVEKRGTALIERSEALGEAARLDELATQKREKADDELHRKRERVAAAPGEARQKTDHKVQEARSAAEQRKRKAAQTAAKRTAEAKQRIDEGAATKVDAVETAKRAKQQTIIAAEQSATAAAKAELDDAADKRSEAVDKRVHADRIEELAEAEKEARQAARDDNGKA